MQSKIGGIYGIGLLCAAWGGAAQAQEAGYVPATGFYFTALAGEAKAMDLCPGTEPCDATGDGLGLGLGYEATPWVSVEFGYLTAGEFESYPVILGVPVNLRTKAAFLALSGVVSAQISGGLSLYGRLGYTRWEVKVRAHDLAGQQIAEVSSDGYSPLYALGVAYRFNAHWAARLEYLHISGVGEPAITGESDGRVIGAGLTLRF